MPNIEPAIAVPHPMAEIEQMKADLARQLDEAKALRAKLELKAEIRTEVSEAVMDERRRKFGKPTPAAAPPMPPKPDEKLFAVKLDRHYAPCGYYEVVGYHKDAVMKKAASGQMVEVEPAEFIENEKKPPSIGGVGFPTKIWAGTVLRVPESEARTMRRNGVATLDFD